MRATAVQHEEGRVNASTVLAGILLGGLVLRLFFIGAEGYRTDVSSFMSWALTAAQNPLSEFYAKAGFADYPPGYLFVLWIVGHLYLAIPHAAGDYSILRFLVKLPACLADVVNAGLIFLIVRRFASPAWANFGAALYAFNPATIYVSAYWGQVDAVPAAFMLGAVALLLYAPERAAPQARLLTIGAWLAISYAILIKPPSVMVALLMLVWAFVRRREIDAALGIACGFVLGYVVAFVFHPSVVGAIPWLWERYAYGSAVYPYNSVNAFNLHSLFRPFWQPDTTPVMFGPLAIGPMWLWGILLVAAAAVLVVARYLQRRDDAGFIEAAMLL
ncbi:MAG: hypothetical protein ACRENA_15750, partial [Vulcanimicrobiaceae bacterium]